ncbi:uncharacterized protein [Rutidosis leptorrhynchoides]|uniref:uncharacterized protein n=1 Tax=Rutidosis leptorrhynchoides TaxID=125765 RepID=UPI003A9962E5
MSINTVNEPIIIKCRIPNRGIQIKRMHVDTGSSVDIMYEHCYRFLPAEVKARLRQPDIVLSGFSGESSWPLGRIELVVLLADDKNPQLSRSELIDFYVVRSTSRYNALLGRNFIRLVPVDIPSIGEQLKSNAVIANCLQPNKRIKIGAGLSTETKAKLHGILLANADVFAWQESDMTGVSRAIAEHKLNVNPSLTPVRQKKWHMALERSDWLCAEVDNLINMKLSPLKCSFGEEEGKFLGHVVTVRGIKANLKKIEAIDSLPSPRTKKDV